MNDSDNNHSHSEIYYQHTNTSLQNNIHVSKVHCGSRYEKLTWHVFCTSSKKGLEIDPHVSNLRSCEFLFQGVQVHPYQLINTPKFKKKRISAVNVRYVRTPWNLWNLKPDGAVRSSVRVCEPDIRFGLLFGCWDKYVGIDPGPMPWEIKSWEIKLTCQHQWNKETCCPC